jgi:hypothetical protein
MSGDGADGDSICLLLAERADQVEILDGSGDGLVRRRKAARHKQPQVAGVQWGRS